MQVVTIHNNETDEKHKGCNLRLNTATEHEETMSLVIIPNVNNTIS